MRFYLIGAYPRRHELRRYAADLLTMGHSITSDWLTGYEETGDNGLQWQATEEQRMTAAVTDLAGLRSADTVIAFTEPEGSIYTRGGRWVEFGIALGLRKRLLVVGPEESNVFLAIPWIAKYPTWAECLRMLRDLAEMTDEGETIDGSHYRTRLAAARPFGAGAAPDGRIGEAV